jgi:hypothetical protein
LASKPFAAVILERGEESSARSDSLTAEDAEGRGNDNGVLTANFANGRE